MLAFFIDLMERGLLPDALTRLGIRNLCARRLRELQAAHPDAVSALAAYADGLRREGLAEETKAANEQHYEVPALFFGAVLGKHRKYSCAYYPNGDEDLDQAERAALELAVTRAGLEDGMSILELGCGWGSLSLYMAERFPRAQITAISNSSSQREFIEAEARARGLANLEIKTLDLGLDASFAGLPQASFDRVVSIEMFEHFKNYERLLGFVADRLKPGGMLFVHIFTHARFAYPFVTEGEDDWMGRYFFTGGQMPARELLPLFQNDLHLEKQWALDGAHYQKTSEAWLVKMDRHRDEIMPVFVKTYGQDAARWFQRWRVFFLSCAELFGFRSGEEWGVGHYLFRKPR